MREPPMWAMGIMFWANMIFSGLLARYTWIVNHDHFILWRVAGAGLMFAFSVWLLGLVSTFILAAIFRIDPSKAPSDTD
jgi:hypothetical protein